MIKELDTPHKNDDKVKIMILSKKKFFRPSNLQKKSTAGIIIPLAIK
jgi:hypothetical protein